MNDFTIPIPPSQQIVDLFEFFYVIEKLQDR